MITGASATSGPPPSSKTKRKRISSSFHPPPHDHQVKKAIDGLASEPRPHGVKKLSGTMDGYRILTGDFRILYTIDDRKKVVTVYRIRHRREVYRWNCL
ncbi:MAG: type II toxin-antitoxin system RelE/ParE family toxin [Chitinispirillaceae bacterium]|nr:type II toxin-antitoxin system RelE/ParE family toxin [Chitinispirillaceae bacterium]